MDAHRKNDRGIWKRIKSRIRWVLDELKADSIAENPEPPVDCCHPRVYHKPKDN